MTKDKQQSILYTFTTLLQPILSIFLGVAIFAHTKNFTTFSTNSYQKCRLAVILRGNDSLTYTSKMRKFCSIFYTLSSLFCIGRLLVRLVNLARPPRNPKGVYSPNPRLYTLHPTLYTLHRQLRCPLNQPSSTKKGGHPP